MEMLTTTIKIDREVKEAAKYRADKLDMTFFAYTEELILIDIKNNSPTLFKAYKDGNLLNMVSPVNKTAMGIMIDKLKAEENNKLI